MKNFTDFELLELLEANNKEPSYTNLLILKEGIENGTIEIEDNEETDETRTDDGSGETKDKKNDDVGSLQSEGEEQTPPVEGDAKDFEAEIEAPEAQTEIIDGKDAVIGSEITEPMEEPSTMEAPVGEISGFGRQGVNISLPVDGSFHLQSGNKTIMSDPQGNINMQITERFFNSKNIEIVLENFLVGECNMPKKEFVALREDAKVEAIREIASDLLANIQDKIESIDTTAADKSRGDIKQLKELGILQDSITELETIFERDSKTKPEYKKALGVVIKSILYLNQHSNVFKEAYRNKKTLMIMKYESVILSIISSVSYLISVLIDFSDGEVKLKNNTSNVMEFAPIQSLENFVNSVESGEFKTVIRDVTIVREFYLEVPVSKMSVVLEAAEYGDMIIDGIKNITDAIVDGDSSKIINLLYKAAGVIILLFSLREILYTLFKMKTKVSDMVGSIKNFAEINNGGGTLNKLSSFANKFKNDAEYSSDLAHREIEDENKQMFTDVKKAQYVKEIKNNAIDVADDEINPNAPVKDSQTDTDVFMGLDF